MSFVSPRASDFEGDAFQNYRKCVSKSQWSLGIDLSERSDLPAWKQELAFVVASQACHAEHLGMCTASKLVLEAPTAELRYAFAAAAQDEASHSEILGRYALARGGTLDPINEAHLEMVDPLLGDQISYSERAALHTFLEGFALDQFRTFVSGFSGDLLGDIYAKIRQDEARHVALGVLALTVRSNSPAQAFDLDKVDDLARHLGGLSDELFEWLATVEGCASATVKVRYEQNHSRRISEIRRARGE